MTTTKTKDELKSSAAGAALLQAEEDRKAALKARAEYLVIDDVCILHGDSRSAIYRDPQRQKFMAKRGNRTLIHVPTYLQIRGPQPIAA